MYSIIPYIHSFLLFKLTSVSFLYHSVHSCINLYPGSYVCEPVRRWSFFVREVDVVVDT